MAVDTFASESSSPVLHVEAGRARGPVTPLTGESPVVSRAPAVSGRPITVRSSCLGAHSRAAHLSIKSAAHLWQGRRHDCVQKAPVAPSACHQAASFKFQFGPGLAASWSRNSGPSAQRSTRSAVSMSPWRRSRSAIARASNWSRNASGSESIAGPIRSGAGGWPAHTEHTNPLVRMDQRITGCPLERRSQSVR